MSPKGVKRAGSPTNPPPGKKNVGKRICLPAMLHASSCLTALGAKFNGCSKPAGTCVFSHDSIKSFKRIDVVNQFNGFYTKLSSSVKDAVVKYINANASS